MLELAVMTSLSARLSHELRVHTPFTVFGTATGILLMFVFKKIPENVAFNLFYTLHPAHVFVSALATASMYKLHGCDATHRKCNFWVLLGVGLVGSLGIATLSDSIIPYIGERFLKMPHSHTHIGFVEAWWIVNPLAILGVIVAYYKPTTKFPHAAHVLLSVWASLFHILLAGHAHLQGWDYTFIFMFLFLAVWLPCCLSDIIFPLICVKDHYKVHLHSH